MLHFDFGFFECAPQGKRKFGVGRSTVEVVWKYKTDRVEYLLYLELMIYGLALNKKWFSIRFMVEVRVRFTVRVRVTLLKVLLLAKPMT